jgi:hypothetical protein
MKIKVTKAELIGMMVEACILAAHRAVDDEFDDTSIAVNKQGLIDRITDNLTALKIMRDPFPVSQTDSAKT